MSSQKTPDQPTRPADPARTFNDRSLGLIKKINTLTKLFSGRGVDIGLYITTPRVEYIYESKHGMLPIEVHKDNRFGPQDIKRLRGHVLECPYINSMSPWRGRSRRSSPTPSTSSAASTSSAPSLAAMSLPFPTLPPTQPASPSLTLPSARPTSVSPALAEETDPTLPESPCPRQGASLLFPSTDSDSAWIDFPLPTPPVVDISNLLNLNSRPAATDAPLPDRTANRPLPASPPIRCPTTPTPSTSGGSRYRVLKVRALSKPRTR